jgi:hypothetical protein
VTQCGCVKSIFHSVLEVKFLAYMLNVTHHFVMHVSSFRI